MDNLTRRGVLGDDSEIKFTTYLVIVGIKRTKVAQEQRINVVQEQETRHSEVLESGFIGICSDWSHSLGRRFPTTNITGAHQPRRRLK